MLDSRYLSCLEDKMLDGLLLSAKMISVFCVSHSCRECPFYEKGCMFNRESPFLWDAEADRMVEIWRELKHD